MEEDLHIFGLGETVYGASQSIHSARNPVTFRRGGHTGHAATPMNRGKARPTPPPVHHQPIPTRNCSEQFTRSGPADRDVRGGAGHEAATPREFNMGMVSKPQFFNLLPGNPAKWLKEFAVQGR